MPEPVIVLEVLSRSTQAFDRGPKLDAYQQIPSVAQYVLVSQDELTVSVYERDGESWRYRTLRDPDATLAFAVGGATMTLADIYEGATVAAPSARPSASSARAESSS